MISKRIEGRKDGRSLASDALRYGEGLTPDRTTGELLDKSHRTRFGGFGLVDDGVYAGRGLEEMSQLIELAAIAMQANCDCNTRVRADKRLAHFVFSFNQQKPSEAVLRDTEDSVLAALKLADNHFATFLHNDNGYWHLHIFASCIEKGPLHRGNPLWHDKIKRDQICREIEIRHGLARDEGLHRVDELGQIIEIPREERIALREAKKTARPNDISDRAKSKEIYSGEKSFQTWCAEIRIGDRLKRAKSWNDLHAAAAAAYNCELREKGAGFIICPKGEKGGIQLSKIGLKKLPKKFGAFAPSSGQLAQPVVANYVPEPTQPSGVSHYERWQAAKTAFVPTKTATINEQRENHKTVRSELRQRQKAELKQIRASTSGPDRHATVSLAKMEHLLALTALTPQFADERQALRRKLNAEGPGHTYRDFLVSEAMKGDNVALGLARKYGVEESTDVLRQRETDQLKIVAVVAGQEYRPAMRLPATHQVSRNGTVVYNLGSNRTITDSAISKQVQLNGAAANSPEAVAVALRFSMSKFGNTLTLTGSHEWQRMAVEIAVRNHLQIKFADPKLDAYRASLVAVQTQTKEIPRAKPRAQQQLQKGAEHVINRNLAFRTPYDNLILLAEHHAKLASDRRSGLHELSTGSMDGRGGDSEVLLPDALQNDLGDAPAGQDQDVRRTNPGGDSSGRISPAATSAEAQHVHPNERDERRVIRSSSPGERTAGSLHERGIRASSPGRDSAREPAERIDIPVTAAASTIQPIREADQAPAPALPTAEQWLADNTKWSERKDAQLERVGRVLYVAPDGRWVQKLDRDGNVAIRHPVDVAVQVDDLVQLDKSGKATIVVKGVGKGRAD